MAVIKSGDSTDQLHVDPDKAAFVRLRGPGGADVSFPAGLTDGELRNSPVSVAVSNFPAPPSLQSISASPTDVPDASLLATGTGAVSTGFTVTLPAIVGQFHYITLVEITKLNGLAITAAGVAQLITSTNLPGPLTWTYGNGEGGVTIGASSSRIFVPAMPLRSLVAGQPTTIVVPAVTGVIWRVNVWYQVAP